MLKEIIINYNPTSQDVNQLFENIDAWINANNPELSQFQLLDQNAPIEELFVCGFGDSYDLSNTLLETLAEKDMRRPIRFDFSNHNFIRIDSLNSGSDYILRLQPSQLWTDIDGDEPIYTAQLYLKWLMNPPQEFEYYLNAFSVDIPYIRTLIRNNRLSDMFIHHTGPLKIRRLGDFPFFAGWGDDGDTNWAIEYKPEDDYNSPQSDHLARILYIPEYDQELSGVYLFLENEADDELWAKLSNPKLIIDDQHLEYTQVAHCIRADDVHATIIDANRLLGRLGFMEDWATPTVDLLVKNIECLSKREYAYLLMDDLFY